MERSEPSGGEARGAPVVVGGGEQQHRGVLPLLLRHGDVVERAVAAQVLRSLRVVGVAKVGAPRVADRELVEAEHVHHADLHSVRAVCRAYERPPQRGVMLHVLPGEQSS